MRTRTLFILLIILGALAAGGAWFLRSKAEQSPEGGLGKPLIGAIPFNETRSITLKGAAGGVTLERRAEQWTVRERFGYPADFGRIRDLVRKLKEAKIGRQFDASEESLGRLALRDPAAPGAAEGEKGTRVEFLDAKGKPVARILLGQARQSGDERGQPVGQYVRLGEEPTVRLVDQHFQGFPTEPAGWLDKGLLQVKAEDIRRVTATDSGGAETFYAFERPEKGKDLELRSPAAEGKLNRASLNRLAGALAALRIEDVMDPAAPEIGALGEADRLDFELFDGLVYRLFPGGPCGEEKRCLLRVEVDYRVPAGTQPPAPGAEPGIEKPAKSQEEWALEARALNERLAPWGYVIPQWQHGALATRLEPLLEKPEPQATPAQ